MKLPDEIKSVDDATLAKADAMWLAHEAASESPQTHSGDGRDRALMTLIRSRAKAAVKSESLNEGGERLRWIFLILFVFAMGFVTFIAADASVAAKQKALHERTGGR
jgi:hypothetical protein